MTKEFFDDPRRGYGPSIGTVFSKLKNGGFTDIFGPAKEQFKGQGSCGNGSAMRISPAGLLGYKSTDTLVKVCQHSNDSVVIISNIIIVHAYSGQLATVISLVLCVRDSAHMIVPSFFPRPGQLYIHA